MTARRNAPAATCLRLALLLAAWITAPAMAQLSFLQQVSPEYSAFGVSEDGGKFALADFNGDGHLDIVKTTFQGLWLITQYGTGTGEFVPGPFLYDPFPGMIFQDVLSVDVDNDGDQDILVHLRRDGAPQDRFIVAFTNDGVGAFSFRYQISLPTDVQGFLRFDTGDFNGDGFADICVGGGDDIDLDTEIGFLGVMLNDQTGAYGPILPTASLAVQAIAVGDINGDNLDDIVAGIDTNPLPAQNSSAAVRVLVSQGDGTFVEESTFQTLEYISFGVRLLDTDQDGDLDAVSLLFSQPIPGELVNSSVYVLENDGNGELSIPDTEVQYPAFRAVILESVDLNGDGVHDLVLATEDPRQTEGRDVSIYLGTGSGTFSPPRRYKTGQGGPEDMNAGDINGDGHPDILTSSRSHIVPALNNGDGTLAEAPTGQPGGVFALVDLTGDGRDDVVGNIASGQLGIGVSTGIDVELRGFIDGDGSPLFGDFDVDGDVDIVVPDDSITGDTDLQLFENDSTALFEPTIRSEFPDFELLTLGAVLDADLDGDLDVVGEGGPFGDERRIALFLNDGSGRFAAVPLESSVKFSSALASDDFRAADFNSDGHTDFLVQLNGGLSTYVFLNQGGLLFSELALPTPPQGGRVTSVEDLNRDGIPDLFYVPEIGKDNDARFYIGNGDGTFDVDVKESLILGGGVYVLVDIDGDMDFDIARAGDIDPIPFSGVVRRIFLNQGDNTFRLADGTLDQIRIATGPFVGSPVFGDLDGDGDADMVYPGSSDTVLLFNNGITDQCPLDLAEPFGVLDAFDIEAFIVLVNNQLPSADLDRSGTMDFFDVLAYFRDFDAGCP